MDFVYGLPFVLSATAGIIVALISFKIGSSQQDTYTKMAIGMIVFFIIGMYIKQNMIKIIDEIELKKREQEERQKKELLEVQEAARTAAASESGTIPQIEYRVKDDLPDEFTPLNISKVIRTKLDE